MRMGLGIGNEFFSSREPPDTDHVINDNET